MWKRSRRQNRQDELQRDPAQAELSCEDQLFARLDGQEIRGCEGKWRAEVVGIYPDADATWVEIGPARRPAGAVVLRLPDRGDAERALEALERWASLPEDRRPARIDISG